MAHVFAELGHPDLAEQYQHWSPMATVERGGVAIVRCRMNVRTIRWTAMVDQYVMKLFDSSIPFVYHLN